MFAMTTTPLPTAGTDAALAGQVAARRVRAVGAGREVYGAENLPVLICLPDLTARAIRADAPVPSALGGDEPVTLPDHDATAAAVGAHEARDSQRLPRAESALAGKTDTARSPVTEHRVLRTGPRAAPARPFGGIGQYLLAVLVAGALFVIIITVKERREATSAKQAPARRPQVESRAVDVGRSTPTPPMNLSPPDLAPAAKAAAKSDAHSLTTTRDANQPVAPDAAGYADGVAQVTAGYGDYPPTGMEPVQSQSAAASSAVDLAWPTPVDESAARSADRRSTDARYQQR
jgi:hypothetical protein